MASANGQNLQNLAPLSLQKLSVATERLNSSANEGSTCKDKQQYKGNSGSSFKRWTVPIIISLDNQQEGRAEVKSTGIKSSRARLCCF